MDSIERLIQGAIRQELEFSTNPFLTLETIVLRLYRKIADSTRVPPTQCDKTALFVTFHMEILSAYEKLRPSLSHDEKACMERVLSKDSPHPSELVKFASVYFKYNPHAACKLFAVDGSLGTHPKFYVQEAFSPNLSCHCRAVRILYDYFSTTEKVKEIVEKAQMPDESCASDIDPQFEHCVGIYREIVGEEEMKFVIADRESKANQQPSSKRHAKALIKKES